MQYLQRFIEQVRTRLFLMLLIDNVVFVLDWWLVEHVFHLSGYGLIAALVVVPALALTFLPWLSTRYLTQPTKLISEAILHLSPSSASSVASPNPDSANFGKELVASLIHDVYELATIGDRLKSEHDKTNALNAGYIADCLPVPLVVLTEEQTIAYANEVAAKYIGVSAKELTGKDHAELHLDFANEETLGDWLQNARHHNATATKTWERVRLKPTDEMPLRIFDLAAYFSRDNPRGIETIIVMFDRTHAYSQEDQAVSLIALTVHELRTPLTLMRGYIEAFEEELSDKLDPGMRDFMFKMSATAQQLTAFVNNMLNVARIDSEQLSLQLQEQKWDDIVRTAADALALRAKVRGITLEYSLAKNLPAVGADKVRIMEVIDNLVDNAIKYSGKAKRIRISAHVNNEGLVETSVQDFGVGIPDNILPHLFAKFYRDHHNRSQVGGTGLGLYLCRAIVAAHGGNIWVKSKLGEGSTFGFTLIPYDQLTEEQRQGGGNDIVHGAHGWIKNHSLYRR